MCGETQSIYVNNPTGEAAAAGAKGQSFAQAAAPTAEQGTSNSTGGPASRARGLVEVALPDDVTANVLIALIDVSSLVASHHPARIAADIGRAIHGKWPHLHSQLKNICVGSRARLSYEVVLDSRTALAEALRSTPSLSVIGHQCAVWVPTPKKPHVIRVQGFVWPATEQNLREALARDGIALADDDLVEPDHLPCVDGTDSPSDRVRIRTKVAPNFLREPACTRQFRIGERTLTAFIERDGATVPLRQLAVAVTAGDKQPPSTSTRPRRRRNRAPKGERDPASDNAARASPGSAANVEAQPTTVPKSTAGQQRPTARTSSTSFTDTAAAPEPAAESSSTTSTAAAPLPATSPSSSSSGAESSAAVSRDVEGATLPDTITSSSYRDTGSSGADQADAASGADALTGARVPSTANVRAPLSDSTPPAPASTVTGGKRNMDMRTPPSGGPSTPSQVDRRVLQRTSDSPLSPTLAPSSPASSKAASGSPSVFRRFTNIVAGRP